MAVISNNNIVRALPSQKPLSLEEELESIRTDLMSDGELLAKGVIVRPCGHQFNEAKKIGEKCSDCHEIVTGNIDDHNMRNIIEKLSGLLAYKPQQGTNTLPVNDKLISDIDEELCCPVTFDRFEIAVSAVPCGHRFDKSSADDCKKSKELVLCPLCQEKVTAFKPDERLTNLAKKLPRFFEHYKQGVKDKLKANREEQKKALEAERKKQQEALCDLLMKKQAKLSEFDDLLKSARSTFKIGPVVVDKNILSYLEGLFSNQMFNGISPATYKKHILQLSVKTVAIENLVEKCIATDKKFAEVDGLLRNVKKSLTEEALALDSEKELKK